MQKNNISTNRVLKLGYVNTATISIFLLIGSLTTALKVEAEGDPVQFCYSLLQALNYNDPRAISIVQQNPNIRERCISVLRSSIQSQQMDAETARVIANQADHERRRAMEK